MSGERRRRFATPLAAVLLGAALAACSGNSAQRTVPAGVIVPDGPPGKLTGGIYPSVLSNDRNCCWATRDVAFTVSKTEPATDFALKVYLPDTVTYRAHRQGFDAVIDGTYRIHRCCFAAGIHTVLFPLPPALRERTGPVRIAVRSDLTIVPRREGLGPDDRVVSYIFIEASFISL